MARSHTDMSFLNQTAALLTRWSMRWVPDAWVLAVLLTACAFMLAFFFAPGAGLQPGLPPLPAEFGFSRAGALVFYWGSGFWVLATFAMQMCVLVVGGYVIATSPPMQRLLEWTAGRPKTPRGAVALMAFSSMMLSFLHWGLSLLASAMLANAMFRKQQKANRHLLVAAAYLGLGTTWHSGLSASAPLLVSTPGHFMEKQCGVIPITETIFHPFNLALVVIVIAAFTLFVPMLHPADTELTASNTLPEAADTADHEQPLVPATPAERLENSQLINLLVVFFFGAPFLFLYFTRPSSMPDTSLVYSILNRINLDTVNLFFLLLGVLLHRTPASLLKAAKEGGNAVWGIIIQFPFYAGIFGIIQYSGLQDVLAELFVKTANSGTYPALVYWYSGILNYFVPSGGSKWAIEAPYIIQAGTQLDVPRGLVILSYAWGDMMSDIIQPFWAIPLLTITRLKFGDIMGYCLMIFIPYVILVTAAFLLAPLFF